MITTVFDCVSNDKDHNEADMSSIGFMSEYMKGLSQYRERVNLVLATTDNETPAYFEPGARYIVTFTKQEAESKGVHGDLDRHIPNNS